MSNPDETMVTQELSQKSTEYECENETTSDIETVDAGDVQKCVSDSKWED